MEMPFPSPHQKRHWTRTPSKTFVFAPCSGVHNAILAVIWPPGTWRHPKWPHATPQVAAFKTARERQRALSETGEMGENREKNAKKLKTYTKSETIKVKGRPPAGRAGGAGREARGQGVRVGGGRRLHPSPPAIAYTKRAPGLVSSPPPTHPPHRARAANFRHRAVNNRSPL